MARAVIADDERLPREKLRGFLDEVDWIRCVGEAADGLAAVELVNREKPDLLFLDIRMPGLSGIELLERLEHRPTLVFTTAYDEYAVTAFELRALDYLLKPFGRKRFRQTLERVRESLATDDQGGGNSSGVERARDALADERPLRRLFVRSRGRIVPIAIADVARFEAQDDYVAIHTGDDYHLASLRMSDLDRSLDPDRFLRVHRSHIVNLDFVDSIEPHSSGRLRLTMRDGTKFFASRARSQELRKRAV
ncbi:MAG: response regulator transcription factor [Gemmatimonadetes bacterium]|uniref:Response regulator transcription factor n=1 Tax=Candidatus Kutchimonas denitrificans TaxID=3056748 RepID=A0AAE5C8P4_9BACT|nr:response regulator transcription factor [Gemmatimonadota bacterium]NIR74671.1 response regulator transcription factor [Candidatus Kutchimonas denitrificans]NIS01421.1 response regulator transcription factor [Gemmatimonadota bacterium]NIT67162.1 response regulator transcription factor [Gemmatimonadota bacterium]NIU52336.1 response regulator [Gemmatimonadota bacterium]